MSIGLTCFRKVAGSSGFVTIARNGASVTRHSDLIGKAATWLRGVRADESHRAVKREFVATLERNYGKSFVESAAVRDLMGVHFDDATPLKARTVKEIIAKGDESRIGRWKHSVMTLPVAGGKSETQRVYSAYKTTAALDAAATTFKLHVNYKNHTPTLIEDIARYVKAPNKQGLEELKGRALFYASFANTFSHTHADIDIITAAASQQLKDNSVRLFPKQAADLIETVAHTCHSIPEDLLRLSEGLLSAHDDAHIQSASKKILDTTQAQMNDMNAALKSLSDPRMFKGLSRKEAALVKQLTTRLSHRLIEMRNPDGPYQQLIALAACALQGRASLPTYPRASTLPTLEPTHLTMRFKNAAENSDAFIGVHSQYQDERALAAAAETFKEHLEPSDPRIRKLMAYIKNPGVETLEALAIAGGQALMDFGEAFLGGKDLTKAVNAMLTDQMMKNCHKYFPVSHDFNATMWRLRGATASLLQIPTRFDMLVQSLMTAKDANTLQKLANEILQATKSQLDVVEFGLNVLTHPGIFEGVPTAQKDLLQALQVGLAQRLYAMNDTEGPYQQLIAYAAVAAQDPAKILTPSTSTTMKTPLAAASDGRNREANSSVGLADMHVDISSA